MQSQQIHLFRRLHRHEVHGGPLHCLCDRLGIAVVVLVSFEGRQDVAMPEADMISVSKQFEADLISVRRRLEHGARGAARSLRGVLSWRDDGDIDANTGVLGEGWEGARSAGSRGGPWLGW